MEEKGGEQKSINSIDVSIEFIYNGSSVIIQSKLDDKFKDIINKYYCKSLLDVNKLIFLYSGTSLQDEELKLSELLGKERMKEINELMEKDINYKLEPIKILVDKTEFLEGKSHIKSENK